MDFQVELPMISEMDNKGAVDLTNNWSSAGRTRHIDCRHWFMRDLKEDGTLLPVWIPTDKNSCDIDTKNVDGPLFAEHTKVLCGEDEYCN